MKPDVVRQFFRRLHALLQAGDNMNLHAGQARKTVEQRGGAAGQTGRHFGVAPITFAEVHGQEGNFHFRTNIRLHHAPQAPLRRRRQWCATPW